MMSRGVAITSIVIALSLTANSQEIPAVGSSQLKNWTAPLFWQPSGSETKPGRAGRANAASAQPGPNNLQLPGSAVPTADALSFVAMSPCRLVDTRPPGQGILSPLAGTTITGAVAFSPLVTGGTACPVPTLAQAYSLNVTAVPVGAGALGFVTMFPTGYPPTTPAATLTTQPWIVTNAAIVAAGTNGQVSVFANVGTHLIVDINGYYTAPSDLASNANTALGIQSLFSNTTGLGNTAVGDRAARANTTGGYNTSLGELAGFSNDKGSSNTYIGARAGYFNTDSSFNTITGQGSGGNSAMGDANSLYGYAAGYSNAGTGNSFFGRSTGFSNNTGGNNTFVGLTAGYFNTSGSRNTYVGSSAGANNPNNGSNNTYLGDSAGLLNAGGSNNVYLGHGGLGTESNTIRIGTRGGGPFQQNRIFVDSILLNQGVTGPTNPDSLVSINPTTGQLGVVANAGGGSGGVLANCTPALNFDLSGSVELLWDAVRSSTLGSASGSTTQHRLPNWM